ncbi:MAG: cysteine hydrolase family protein [Methanomicrobiales archaeon]|jgi:nicotinamidase-related amidase|nr:cysteine hydrolase [Methanoregulaceae archaeon]MCC7468657.1 cysteine hydrolase [Burkholderiaceae bacterium]NLH25039.1 cysteine hydrolase [Methanomicrobiales archaeon]HNI41318.1 isochorismatase family cysteine hydrolase [Methanoregulaceae archaeon]HNJ80020.1 isochorismatase family cysteine hydrolase [Methanoregulaceae archaeon]
MKKPVLLIIDMQNDFVRDGAPLKVEGADRIAGTIRGVLAEFRKEQLPIFHVIRIHRRDGSDVERFRDDLFRKLPFAVEGTKGAGIISELEPCEGEYIIRKTRMSAFMHTELDLLLRTMGADTLFVTGIQTPNCIRTTVFDACALNYQVYLIEDAVTAKNQEIHRSNCLDMAAIGVGMIRSTEVGRILAP